MSRPRAADDFATIRARMDELRRERNAGPEQSGRAGKAQSGRDGDAERRRRDRVEGMPPPWVPTIFVKKPRS